VVSELMPETAKMVDELCFIRSMHTEHINHDPAITFFPDRPSVARTPEHGAWLSYGLGSANENLPGFVVLISKDRIDQPLYSAALGQRLPLQHSSRRAVSNGADPVLFLKNPDGVSADSRRKMLDRLADCTRCNTKTSATRRSIPAWPNTRWPNRMQTSVPDVMDLSKETEATFELYGKESKEPGTFAANCLLARRLAERNVRFIQLIIRRGIITRTAQRHPSPGQGRGSRLLCADHGFETARLLNDTLVVWGGEFGRTELFAGQTHRHGLWTATIIRAASPSGCAAAA